MRLLLGLAASLGLALLGSAALAEEPRRDPRPAPSAPKLVPGTQVSLAAPEGFVPAARYPGFESTESGSSVMISEIRGPYAEVVAGMTEEGLARAGMKLVERRELEIAGRRGILLRAEQTARGIRYAKWLVLFGDDRHAVQIVANHPADRPDLGEPLRICLTGATWDPKLAVDPYAYLPFTLECPPELKFFAKLQNSLLFTRTGDKRESAADATFTVGPSLSPVRIPDLGAFAEQRLRQIPEFKVEEVLASASIEVAGLAGRELLARVIDAKSGAAEHVYLVVLPDTEGYYLLFGSSAYAEREIYLPVFRRFTASFRLRAPPSRPPSDGK